MPDDKRIDLNAEIDHSEMMAGVHAASQEVKKLQDAEKAKQARQAEQKKSRSVSAVVIAVAAVAILLLSYFIVFGGQGSSPDSSTPTRGAASSSHSPYSTGADKPTCVTPCAPQAPPRATGPVGGSSQNVERPPDGYEKPGDDTPGM